MHRTRWARVGLHSYPCYPVQVSTTQKISVTLGREELRGAKRIASRLGLSLSTFITDAVRSRIEQQARLEAGLAVLATFEPADRATPEEMQALLDRWTAPPGRPRKKARGRRRRSRSGD